MSGPPGEGRGFFPGDDLSQMPSGGRQIEWLKLGMIAGYREYMHDPETGTSLNLLTGVTYKDRYTPADWDELARSLREEGFREPLKLEYEPDTRRAFFGEGNHRLVAAGLAGYSAVPVWGLLGYPGERMSGARWVPGEPKLSRDEAHGYFPGSFRPSDVLPPHYLYRGENSRFCPECGQQFPRGRAPEHVAAEHPAQWRQAWQRNSGLRAKYPHLPPGTAAQPAGPSVSKARDARGTTNRSEGSPEGAAPARPATPGTATPPAASLAAQSFPPDLPQGPRPGNAVSRTAVSAAADGFPFPPFHTAPESVTAKARGPATSHAGQQVPPRAQGRSR